MVIYITRETEGKRILTFVRVDIFGLWVQAGLLFKTYAMTPHIDDKKLIFIILL